MNPFLRVLSIVVLAISTIAPIKGENNKVAVFITIGQSNADGSAFFDKNEDARLKAWYDSPANPDRMKIWYRSCKVENQKSNALGERARWVVEGDTVDAQPGWMNLWYRNENSLGRTSMNMNHSRGTYSTGSGVKCAQGRRGMEGEFGMKFAQAFPNSDLYILKLGASGSFISSWANPADDTNWTYFYNNIFRPAMTNLLAQGKQPYLAGVWFMQGCADRAYTKEYYEECLNRLVERLRGDLGFKDAKIYIGHILKPGENPAYEGGSVQYGQGVRDAQDAVAAATEGVEIIDTKDCAMQYEKNFNGYLHFSHVGVNQIGDKLAVRVIADGPEGWASFSTPGKWIVAGETAVFIPAVGTPSITYSTEGNKVTATISHPGFTETKTLVK